MRNHAFSSSAVLWIALAVMALWGSLFAAVKRGYGVYGVDTSRVGDLLLFAGLRFFVCGAVISALALCLGQRPGRTWKRGWGPLAEMGLLAVTLHYACTYVGLSYLESAETALLKQLGGLLFLCFSFLLVRGEKFSPRKLAAALVGFGGIAAMNRGGGFSLSLGTWLILGASVCTVVSAMAGKRAMETTPPLLATGLSQTLGGGLLLAAGLLAGGTFPHILLGNTWLFVYICLASAVSYSLWYAVVRGANLSRLFLIKFSEPLFSAFFGMLLLGEDVLQWRYLVALVCIFGGILLGEWKPRVARRAN